MHYLLTGVSRRTVRIEHFESSSMRNVLFCVLCSTLNAGGQSVNSRDAWYRVMLDEARDVLGGVVNAS